MALAGKTSKKFYVTSGGGSDEINAARKAIIDGAFDADLAKGNAELIDNNTLGPVIYNIQRMQDDLDELRRFVDSASEIRTVVSPLPIANGGTGVSTAQAAIDALSAVSGASTNECLIKDGSGNATWAAQTDTTYTAGDGLDLSTTTFSTDIKANSGITIDSTELSMDLGASSITGTLAVGDGGTGLTTVATDEILTGNGAGALTSETELKFYSSSLVIGSATDSSVDKIARAGGSTDINGGDLSIYGGDTRPSASTNRTGGSINLYGGLSTGNAASGNINIYTGWEGVSGTGQLGPGKHSTFLSTATKNTLDIYEPNSLANDYFQIEVVASGATTITTVDAAAHAADLTFNVDGDAEIAADVITLDSAGDIELETGAVTNYINTTGVLRSGNQGDIQYVSSEYYIPITATEFQGEVETRGGDAWGMETPTMWVSADRAAGFIEKLIPLGFKATDCTIWGAGTNTFTPYEGAINSGSTTARGSATAVGSNCAFSSDVVGDGLKTISIALTVADGRDQFYGGKITLEKV